MPAMSTTRARDGMNRLHRVLTRALDVLRVEGGEHAPTWSDTERLNGYVLYARCTLDLLAAHHQSEDEIVFPFIQRDGPLPAVTALDAQHHAVEAALAQLRVRIGRLAGGGLDGPGRQAWRDAIATLRAAWDAHVVDEEAVFDAALVGLSPDDDAALAKRIDRHGRAHSGPGPVMLPFLLFNLTGSDRLDFEGRLPWILTGLLIPKMWARRWTPMRPFLVDC